MNYYHPSCNEIWIKEVLNICKTGDLILFKAMDNFNSSKIFSYFTHIGVIFTPKKLLHSITDNHTTHSIYIFEAQSPNNLELEDHENKKGIYITNLYDRLSSYKGRLYYKPLNKFVDNELNNNFQTFIDYAIQNMYYENNVIWNGIKKKLFFESLHEGTNCGELALLSLIKLGILDQNKFNWKALHHLYWMANIEECDNGFYYLPYQKIKLSPFTNPYRMI
jgi:hypothetical protein